MKSSSSRRRSASGRSSSEMPERASRSKTISCAGVSQSQLADAALGRMQAQLQALERATGDDELAIEHEVLFGDLLESLATSGK